VHLNEAKTKNPKLARWAMKLAQYNFTLKHRAGKVHNNADGLSRSYATPAPDTPPADCTAIDTAELPPSCDPLLLQLALDAFELDTCLDGDDPALYVADAADSLPLGPRQLLLESAPCHACSRDIAASSRTSVVCDRCNKPFHLACVALGEVPRTYWYCSKCSSHHRAHGLTCPTQDLALQRYLLDLPTPRDLHANFAAAARLLSFTDQLYAWRGERWLPYPPEGLQVLLLEEEHLRHCHVGGEKLFHLLEGRYYWPSLRADCARHASHCFECQISAGRSTGSWAGKLLPLPPGPRVVWACDLIEQVGGPDIGKAGHILVVVDCYSKFCLLHHIADKASATVAAALQQRLFSVFGAPAALRCDNGTAFKGAVTALCEAKGTKVINTSPYTSHSNGQVERFNRTVEDLLRRHLVTMPAALWPTLLPEVQLALNTTYAKSLGCPPYLVMFGSTPPDSALTALPDPAITPVQRYSTALQRQLTTI
jgi:transposase InsO family protein